MKAEYLKLNNEDIHIKCYAIVQTLNCYLKEKERKKKVRDIERNRERDRGRKKERRKEGKKGRNLPKTVIF